MIEWMSHQVKKKILIADAKVPLSWLKNKDLRTQPYVQIRIHNICKTFEADEVYYIRSKDNPSDLGTKFDNFKYAYQMLDEDSLFRNGPKCLEKGIEAAVASKRLIPLNNISLTAEERALAALEVVKLHQLVITRDENENFSQRMRPSDTINEETIDDTIACLIMSDDEAVDREHWLNTKITEYRAQKATSTVRSKITQVEKFSNYLISPVRKNYETFFRSMMTTFKAI